MHAATAPRATLIFIGLLLALITVAMLLLALHDASAGHAVAMHYHGRG